MFKKLREYPLTPAQYRKANRAVALAMTLSYIVFLAFAVVKDPVFERIVKPPVIAYLVAILAVTALYAQKHIREKKAMLFMVVAYAWVYGSMAIMYDATFMPIIFPVFLALTVYLNERLIAIGASTFMLILIAKAVGVVQHGRGNTVEVGICNTIFVAIIFIMVVGIKAIGVLIDFSNDASAKIASKAAKQLEVAHQVETIVNELDDSFHELVDELTVINYSIDSTNNVMDQIATGSENTAEETVRQAMMTSEIQNRLKETSEIATDAKVTTDDLKAVIVNGKAQSDELSRQSQLVDDNTVEISKTVDHLVSNVSRVSDITDTILNISSQTNLLALNASIEAARAGEAGKGFAVVADEIRKLAEETKTSTEKITEIVNELIAVTNETQHGLQASVESINLQRESVKEVTGSFAAIEQGMASLYGGMNSVNEQVGAVLDANQTIVDGISTLSGISEEISAETATSRTNMVSLVDSMHKFSKVVESAFSSLQILKETAAVEEEVEED